jgi:hypothetical protein
MAFDGLDEPGFGALEDHQADGLIELFGSLAE